MSKITPAWVTTFETNLQELIQASWARTLANKYWDKLMDVKQSQTGQEIYFWLLETARIYPQGQGGNRRYDDITVTNFTIVNQDSGSGLILTKNEIEDNQMVKAKGMSTLDYSANWARQVGGNAAYWPQQNAALLLQNGEVTTGPGGACYDGLSFFNANHPINPYLGAASGVYSNLLAAKPIDETNAPTIVAAAKNFGDVIASIQGLKGPNGAPRNLVPRYLMHGPDLRKRANELLGSQYLVAAAAAGAGTISNVLTTYAIEPILMPEFTSGGDIGVYYIVCEMMAGEGGGLIYQDRSPYELNSYVPESQIALQRRREFEWTFDGRNAAAYGHPYLIFKVKPT